MFLLYVINVIGTNKFFGFLVWGRVPGWWLKSRGGGGGGEPLVWRPPFKFLGYTLNGHLV